MTFWPFRKSTEVWLDGFKEGYKKAWETMMPTFQEGMKSNMKFIENKSISETLERMGYGNHKKDK